MNLVITTTMEPIASRQIKEADLELPVFNEFYEEWNVVNPGSAYYARVTDEVAQALIAEVSNKPRPEGWVLIQRVVQVGTRGRSKGLPETVTVPEWQKEWVTVYQPETKVTVKSHKYREILQDAISLKAWDDDSELPCIGMSGTLTTSDGQQYKLSGTRDVGVRTGYHPKLNIVMPDYALA